METAVLNSLGFIELANLIFIFSAFNIGRTNVIELILPKKSGRGCER